MEEVDYIRGNNRHAVFKDLLENKTLMQMNLVGRDYEQLEIFVRSHRVRRGQASSFRDYGKNPATEKRGGAET